MEMLPGLGLSSFDTVYGHSFSVVWNNHQNAAVKLLRYMRPYAFLWMHLIPVLYCSAVYSAITFFIFIFSIYGMDHLSDANKW